MNSSISFIFRFTFLIFSFLFLRIPLESFLVPHLSFPLLVFFSLPPLCSVVYVLNYELRQIPL